MADGNANGGSGMRKLTAVGGPAVSILSRSGTVGFDVGNDHEGGGS